MGIGYKLLRIKYGDPDFYLATLEIDDENNENRSNCIDRLNASHRTSAVTPLSIVCCRTGHTIACAENIFYHKKEVYTVRQVLICPDYDHEIENVCSQGFHYFLNREIAMAYRGGTEITLETARINLQGQVVATVDQKRCLINLLPVSVIHLEHRGYCYLISPYLDMSTIIKRAFAV